MSPLVWYLSIYVAFGGGMNATTQTQNVQLKMPSQEACQEILALNSTHYGGECIAKVKR